MGRRAAHPGLVLDRKKGERSVYVANLGKQPIRSQFQARKNARRIDQKTSVARWRIQADPDYNRPLPKPLPSCQGAQKMTPNKEVPHVQV